MPSRATCPDEAELLTVAAGEPASADLQRHLVDCSKCRNQLEQLRREVAGLREQRPDGLQSSSTASVAVPDAGTANDGADNADATARRADAESSETRTSAAQTDVGFTYEPGTAGEASFPAAIGKYLVIGRFPRTGQADVFRVVHPGLGKDLVLKLSLTPVRPDGRCEIIEEGKILAELDHPNLVRVYDSDFHDDRPFIVMEYVRGQTLEQVASGGGLKPRQAAALLAKVAAAADYAHTKGIVHRDIKPKNILVDEAGEPRLIDFGMARLRHAWSNDPGSPGGTFAFMPPEQARVESPAAQAKVGPRSDVFALGAVLYFLLTGQAPFPGNNWRESMNRARVCDFDRAALHDRRIPRGLRRICLKAMAADPADRHASADEIRRAFAWFLRRPVMLAGAVSVFLVSALLGVVVSRGSALRSSLDDPSGASLQPASPKAVAMATGVQTLVKVDRQGAPLELPEALPLRTGDLLWIECGLPRGWRASVFWFDSEGHLTELAPSGHQRDSASDRISYPIDGATTLVGPAGTDFIFVCARSASPPQLGELVSLFPGGQPLPHIPDTELIVLDRERVEIKAPSKPGPDTRGAGPIQASAARELVKTLDSVRVALAEKFEFVAGVSFPHRDSWSKTEPSTNPVK
jgi:eukaryotic-like serine/threonine-protein kinase